MHVRFRPVKKAMTYLNMAKRWAALLLIAGCLPVAAGETAKPNILYIRYEDGTEELYDHEVDPNEWHNVAMRPVRAAAKSKLSAHIPEDQAVMSEVSSFTWNDYWREKSLAAKVETPAP